MTSIYFGNTALDRAVGYNPRVPTSRRAPEGTNPETLALIKSSNELADEWWSLLSSNVPIMPGVADIANAADPTQAFHDWLDLGHS